MRSRNERKKQRFWRGSLDEWWMSHRWRVERMSDWMSQDEWVKMSCHTYWSADSLDEWVTMDEPKCDVPHHMNEPRCHTSVCVIFWLIHHIYRSEDLLDQTESRYHDEKVKMSCHAYWSEDPLDQNEMNESRWMSQIVMSHTYCRWSKDPSELHMGWLWLVGSFKLYVSFAKEPYKRDYTL